MLAISYELSVGKQYAASFPPNLVQALDELFASGSPQNDHRVALKLETANGPTDIMMTASPLEDETGSLGTVLFFDDVSQIAKVERMEAWREVARRIAHEIKNPLTPIQLSAERLRRQLGGAANNGSALVDECTKTIIGEVEDLKRLVNEFSTFARLPHLNPVPGDLNPLAEETVNNFRAANPNIGFGLTLEPHLPQIAIDREALKRALVNLLDNAVGAVRDSNHNGAKAKIDVLSAYDHAAGLVRLEISDNGAGIDPQVKTRIFEPYFSTKRGGTGLGLAIVSAIIADHHGFIRVRDNEPTGSRFVLEFPIKMRHSADVSG